MVDLLGCPSKLCFEPYVFKPHMELLNHFQEALLMELWILYIKHLSEESRLQILRNFDQLP